MSITCFNCTNEVEITEKTYFCPFCIVPIICKGCGEPLIKDAIGCGSCGTLILSKENQQDRLNEIEFEQKGDSKKFKAIFTDNVGHDLVATFGGMVGMSIQKKNKISIGKQSIGLSFSSSAEDIEDVNEFDEDDISKALLNVFKQDGDKLILQTTTLKATKDIHKSIRVALLTLFAYKVLQKVEDLDRQKLTDVLGRAKLNSGNFRSWISNCDEIIHKGKNLIFLSVSGQEKALEVLKEVLNPEVIDGSVVFSKNSSKSKRKKSNSDEPEVKEGKKTSGKSPKEFVLKLISEKFFENKQSTSEIIQYLKINYASNFSSGQIATVLGRLIGEQKLKREKGDSGNYVYFV